MIEINYINGDVTNIQTKNNIIIPHICNDLGAWGAGFVLALSKKWKMPEIAYRKNNEYILGNVQFVRVEDNVIVANMIAQHNVRSTYNLNPIDYKALEICLKKVNEMALTTFSSIHMPKIGAGLAGGYWNSIEKIIENTLTVKTTVFIFNE